MAQKYGFFNSVNKDRIYDASDVARFLSKFFTNGIFNNSLSVSANDNMTVSVAIGNANINGYGYDNTEELILDIDDADNELSRIDSVVIRLDLTNRQITAEILQGQYATTPSQPSITRSGNIYDLRLANILVPAGATRITADMITDTRFGSDCGNVVQAVQHLDTTDIFSQYETYFKTWLQNLQDQLDENQAGHLQNEINDINSNLKNVEEQLNNAAFFIDKIYPVGSIYLSVNNTNPATLFGGTWERWGQGKVPVGVDETDDDFKLVEKAGGEKKHTLKIQELPREIWHSSSNSQTAGTKVAFDSGSFYGANSNASNFDQPHNNLQPYITVYMWKRTK